MENSNSVNTTEQNKKKNLIDLKQEFLDELILANKSPENWKINPEFIDKVMKENTVWEDLKEKMKKLKSSNNKYKNDLYIDSIDIYDLRRRIANDYLKLQTAKNLFISEVKKTYVIDDDKVLDKIIKSELEWKWKSEKDIYELINSPKKMEIFLKEKIPGLKTFEFKKLFSEIKTLKESDIEKKLKWKSSAEKDEIMFILQKIKNGTYTDSDIRWLFEFNILDYKAKQNLIEAYIPVINLNDAVNIWLLTKLEAEQKRKDIVIISCESLFKGSNIDEDTKENIINNTSLEDIILKSKDLYNENNINLLAKNIWFKNLEQDFNSLKEEIFSKIEQDWPQTFDELTGWLEKINQQGRFKDLQKFKKRSIIKFITKDSENNEVVSYIEITDINDDKKEFTYKLIWNWSNISLKSDNRPEEKKSYVDFFEWLKQKVNTKFECFSLNDIKDEIKSWNLIKNEFEKISLNDLDESTKSKYKISLEQDIKKLEDEISIESDEKNKNKKQKLLEQKKDNLKLYNNNLSDELLVTNKLRFIEKIDEIDPDWKNIWFWKWLLFQVWDDIFEISWFENEISIINSISNFPEWPFDLETFFDTFKQKKAKRIEKIEDFSNLIDISFSDSNNNGHEKWKDHDIVGSELIAKWIKTWDKTSDKVVDYLVWDKTNDLIKINNISWNQVTVQFWERKDYSDISEDEKKKIKIWKDDKWEMISLENKEYTISLNDLNNLIKKDDLYPSWKTWKEIEPEKIKDLQNKFKWSFFSQLFSRTSFKELLAWWKMFFEWIEETLKKWNSLHSAEFAMKMWKFLPKDLWADMMIKVERAQQEQQDKELENLWKVDSPIAVGRIKRWLLNRNTPEYKKEAGILFMLEKYGHLTAKGALYEYRWKRLWYEALGWRENDALFLKTKAEAEASDITFSEEFLVHILLKDQCAWRTPPKRRSRLHKEYEGKWKAWVTAEFDKWYWDADKKRTASDIVKGWNDEATWWTTSNAIWWYKKAVERGWSLEDMSEGFFALLFSGALYNIDQATFLKIKNLWDADGMPMIMTKFSTKKSEMILFNKAVVEICKKIEENYPIEHEWIHSKAKKLFNDAIECNWSEKERFNDSVSFWKKHWTPIVRALNMVNVKDNKYSKTDKIVILEKDNNNEVLKKYYDNVREYTSWESSFWQWFMDDDCWAVGISWLNVFELTKKYLTIDQTLAFRQKKTWPIVWKEISDDINSINSKTFDDDDPEEDRRKKEKYLVHIFRDLSAGVLSIVWSDRLSPFNDSSSNMWQSFNKWGLNFSRDLWGFSPDDVMLWNNKKVNDLLLRIARNVLNWWWWNNEWLNNPLDELTNTTKKATNNAVYPPT
jgi:hypothetical protein